MVGQARRGSARRHKRRHRPTNNRTSRAGPATILDAAPDGKARRDLFGCRPITRSLFQRTRGRQQSPIRIRCARQRRSRVRSLTFRPASPRRHPNRCRILARRPSECRRQRRPRFRSCLRRRRRKAVERIQAGDVPASMGLSRTAFTDSWNISRSSYIPRCCTCRSVGRGVAPAHGRAIRCHGSVSGRRGQGVRRVTVLRRSNDATVQE
jgi:hypothetical protein